MRASIEVVDGVAFADVAARILEQSWSPPALRYTPAYLRWQLGFPSEIPAVSVAAFAHGEPIGFAAFTPRRLRRGEVTATCAVVSFVAVLPAWRSQGIADSLYERLLFEIATTRANVLTFGIGGSAGERALLRAYGARAFAIHGLGTYPTYTYMDRNARTIAQFDARVSNDGAELAEIVACCAKDERLLWSDPTRQQIAHYLCDPRPRKLAILERGDQAVGAAWIVRLDFATTKGPQMVTTLESVFLDRQDPDALLGLLRFAASVWKDESHLPVVGAPSLYGFNAAALRRYDIRQTGQGFNGYLCSMQPPRRLDGPLGTNLEVI